jgi:hypothetical protein
MTGIPQRYLLHALRIELRTCNTTQVNHEQAPECQESRHRVEDLTNGAHRARTAKQKKNRRFKQAKRQVPPLHSTSQSQ